MPHGTENTINDRIAEYLREKGFEIYTEFKGQRKGSNNPDFAIKEPRTIYGEGEWAKSKDEGYRQMLDYSKMHGSEGSFLLIYPDSLTKKEMVMDIEQFFGKTKLRGLFYLKSVTGAPSNPFYGYLWELPDWLEKSVQGEARLDKHAQIEIIRDLVDGLAKRIPQPSSTTSLFKHVADFLPEPKGALKTTNRAVAYLLVDQLVFYRILSANLGLNLSL